MEPVSLSRRAVDAFRREWLAMRTIAVTLESALSHLEVLTEVRERSERASRLVMWADRTIGRHVAHADLRLQQARELVAAGDDGDLPEELKELMKAMAEDTDRARAARQRAVRTAETGSSTHNGNGSG